MGNAASPQTARCKLQVGALQYPGCDYGASPSSVTVGYGPSSALSPNSGLLIKEGLAYLAGLAPPTDVPELPWVGGGQPSLRWMCCRLAWTDTDPQQADMGPAQEPDRPVDWQAGRPRSVP